MVGKRFWSETPLSPGSISACVAAIAGGWFAAVAGGPGGHRQDARGAGGRVAWSRAWPGDAERALFGTRARLRLWPRPPAVRGAARRGVAAGTCGASRGRGRACGAAVRRRWRLRRMPPTRCSTRRSRSCTGSTGCARTSRGAARSCCASTMRTGLTRPRCASCTTWGEESRNCRSRSSRRHGPPSRLGVRRCLRRSPPTRRPRFWYSRR